MAAKRIKEKELLQEKESGITVDIWQLAYCFLKEGAWKEGEMSHPGSSHRGLGSRRKRPRQSGNVCSSRAGEKGCRLHSRSHSQVREMA